MPFLDSIVFEINESIRTKIDSKKVQLSMYGISKQLPRTDTDSTQIPVYVDNSGEGQFNAFDDNFSVCIYHKCDSLTYEPVEGLGFGDGQDFSRETANMQLFCWGDRNKLQMSQEWLAAVVSSGFPVGMNQTFRQSRPGLNSVDINIVSVENNSQTVWSREFQNIDYSLKPESIYFQTTYTIQTVFHKSCMALCDECPPPATDLREECGCVVSVLMLFFVPNTTIVQIEKVGSFLIPINLSSGEILANPQLLADKIQESGVCDACSATMEETGGAGSNVYTITINTSAACGFDNLTDLTWDELGTGTGSSSFESCS